MKRVECIGMVGKLPTPEGALTFYDTGRHISREELNKALALQYAVFNTGGDLKKLAIEKAYKLVKEIAERENVYPVGKAALTDDGRILVTEPWFQSKEQEA